MAGIQSVFHDQSWTADRFVGLASGRPQSADYNQWLDSAHYLHDPSASRNERREWAAVDARPGQDAARRAEPTDRTEGHRRLGHVCFARMGQASPHGRKCQQLRALLERHIHQSTKDSPSSILSILRRRYNLLIDKFNLLVSIGETPSVVARQRDVRPQRPPA